MGAVGVAGRLRQQHRHHGAEDVGNGRIVPGQRRHEAGGGEARLDDQCCSIQQRLEKGIQGVGVEHRQGGHQHIALADADQVAGINRPPEILRVRTAHAFGQARGAGGVEDRKRVARLDRMRRHARLRRREGQAAQPIGGFLAFITDQPQGFDRTAAAIERRDDRSQFALDHQQPGPAIAEDVLKLCAARCDIDGNRNGPKPGAAQYGEEEFGAVTAHEGDAVAGLDAVCGQGGGVAGRGFLGLDIGESHATDRDEPRLPMALCLTQEHAGHGPLGRRKELPKPRCPRFVRQHIGAQWHGHPCWLNVH
jgi:hypothetical protein